MSTYPHLFAALIESGWREKDLAKLAGGNLLRVFQEVEKVRDEELWLRPSARLLPKCVLN